MKVEDIKLSHCLARLNENGKWQPSTTRFYRREDGTMHVFEFDTEYEAIDKERSIRKENPYLSVRKKEIIWICNGTNPYDGQIGAWKYSSKQSLPITFNIGDRPIKDILQEIISKGMIKEGEWIEIEF